MFSTKRNFRLFFGLLTLDTTSTENKEFVLTSKEEAQSHKNFDAFLEAVPQSILQLSIIFQTGTIGEFLPQRVELDSLAGDEQPYRPPW